MRRRPRALPFLPPEITDIIIDHCHSDISLLIAFSLVCKQWLPSTRYHLFQRPIIRQHNAISFALILKAPLCTIRTSIVRGLVIDSWPDIYSLRWLVRALQKKRVKLGYLSLNFLHCPEPTQLPSFSSLFLLSNSFGEQITQLEIKAWYTLNQFLQLACSFRNLNNLSLCIKTPTGHGVDVPYRLPESLRRLELYSLTNANDDTIVPWLYSQHLPRLSDLELTRLGYNSRDYMPFCFESIGSQLRHLSITVSDQALPIGDLPQLRSLTCIIYQSLAPLGETFAMLQLPRLETLIISAHCSVENALWAVQTPPDRKYLLDGLLASHLIKNSDLDRLAASPSLSTVRNFTLAFRKSAQDCRVFTEEFVRAKLSSWDEKGVLRIFFL